MMIRYARSLLVALVVAGEPLLAFDARLTVEFPRAGATYRSGVIQPLVALEFGDGPVSNAVRLAPTEFQLCVEWSSAAGRPINATCCILGVDGALSLPSLFVESLDGGLYFFRASLGSVASDTKPLSRIEVPYFIAADREPPLDTIKNGSSTVEDPSMPCEWRGSFAAVAPWSKAYSSDTHTHASAHSRK